MNIEPKTEEEVSNNLWPVGEYQFKVLPEFKFNDVVLTQDTTSKNGNEMIVLVLQVYNENGQERIVCDYLVNTDGGQFKIRHAAVACSLEEEYQSGTLLADSFIGKTGMLKLGIQKDKTGQYSDRNSVKDYIIGKVDHQAPSDGVPSHIMDDDIGF